MSTNHKLAINQLIITRPAGQGEALVEQLKLNLAPSLKVRYLPLMAIEPIEFNIPDMPHCDGAIFVSINAVNHFFNSNDCLLRSRCMELISKAQLIAVGESSAKRLESKARRQVIYPCQMNAEGVIDLAELKLVKDQHWIVIKGSGGRNVIQQALVSAGAKITELEVYRRKLPDFQLQQTIFQMAQASPTWVISSAEAIDNLYRILGLAETRDHATKVIITSDRLALAATKKGFDIVAQSAGASNQQLIECVSTVLQARR